MAITRSPFHLCDICGTKQHLSDMVLQKGQLRCRVNNCVDNLLVEQRDKLIQQVLSSGPDAPPDPKLVRDFDAIEETTL